MGGDGGVIASNRRYMRGAGTADHTADSSRSSASDVAEANRERLNQAMRMCAVSGTPFDFAPFDGDKNSSSQAANSNYGGIVVCPYGRLYTREAAVQALSRRLKEVVGDSSASEIGWHVRGMKDLHPVRFHVAGQACLESSDKPVFLPVCPIVGVHLNGLHPAYVITNKLGLAHKKKKKSKEGRKHQDTQDSQRPNVISEKAIKEMGYDTLQEEYGPFQKEDLIRLVPPSGLVFDEIRDKLALSRKEASLKINKKKRKNNPTNDKICNDARQNKILAITKSTESKRPRSSMSSGAVQEASSIDLMRKNVAAAVASSSALSSLFENKSSHLSEKEKKNNLFVR